jgi:hypothetical protein
MHGTDVTLSNLKSLSPQECLKSFRWTSTDEENQLLFSALCYMSLTVLEKNDFFSLFSRIYYQDLACANQTGDTQKGLLLNILKEEDVPFFTQKEFSVDSNYFLPLSQ